jgi:hypothetical protein
MSMNTDGEGRAQAVKRLGWLALISVAEWERFLVRRAR